MNSPMAHAMGLSINNQSQDQAAASPGLTRFGNFEALSHCCYCLIHTLLFFFFFSDYLEN